MKVYSIVSIEQRKDKKYKVINTFLAGLPEDSSPKFLGSQVKEVMLEPAAVGCFFSGISNRLETLSASSLPVFSMFQAHLSTKQ